MQAAEAALLAKLTEIGYTITTDWRPARLELHHAEHGYIDIHPLQIAPSGSARQAMPDGSWYDFAAEWFTSAQYAGRTIPCLSVEAQRLFHSGYELRDIDRLDLANLETLAHGREEL